MVQRVRPNQSYEFSCGGWGNLPPSDKNNMRFTSANRTTRFGDLNHLEELRNLNRGKFTQQLDRIYRQSQDDELERLRRLLVEAHKRHDLKRVDEIERYLYQYQLKHR